MYVVNFVNSFIGRPGNIGQRTSYILNQLRSRGIIHKSVSRGCDGAYDDLNVNMGVWGQLARILNAYRIYIDMNFNHRIWDIKLFEYFCLWNQNFWLKDIKTPVKIAHIWEYSPKLIEFLKDNKFKVVLDVPMAPTATSRQLIEKFGNSLKLHPHDSIDKLERDCFRIADFIIAPSEFVKNELVKMRISPAKIFVIPFGANGRQPSQNAKISSERPRENGIHFCFAGNISARKGIDTLLEAWNHPIFMNDTLHLCGRLYPDMVKLIAKFNFKNIRTPGFVDVHRYFQDCDVYVFPSFLEGSSKSVYQAMASGLPCIVTPNTGSIIRDGQDGFIVDPGNAETLRDAMKKFREEPHLIHEMGFSGASYVRSFSWLHYAESVISVYQSIAHGEANLFERRI
jgi:glycosyltransferase involved in cell wall biosynthesis